MNRLFLPIWMVVAIIATSCSEDTADIGFELMPDSDKVTSVGETFTMSSTTLRQEAVVARSGVCYLGSVVDPELKVKTTCDFLGQFHLPSNFVLPEEDKMVKSEADGRVVADSIDVCLYYDSYYGDPLSPMKISVLPLRLDNVLEEDENYKTDINPMDFTDVASPYKASASYTAFDTTRPSDETDGTTYYQQIKVKLPVALGTHILRQYYEKDKDGFQNSYHFIHKVFPGFYFRHAGGVGTMISAKMTSLNLYFSYHSTTTEGKDTVVVGFQRFGGTPEVIQTTRVDNTIPDNILPAPGEEEDYTLLKTPTGLFTEISLPIAEICRGTKPGQNHYTDSISKANISIRKYNFGVDTKYPLSAPTYLLMVAKSRKDEFFEKRELPDSKSSYLSEPFESGSTAYQFKNISQLITDLRLYRDKMAGVVDDNGHLIPGLTDEERERRYREFDENPENSEWNKVVLIPIEARFSSVTDGYGNSSNHLQRVNHFLGLSSAKLEGGKDKLKINIVYTGKK